MNAGVTLNFDASQVKVEDRFEAIPADWYNVTVTNTERKPSSQNPQNSYMEVEHTIMDGQYAGRKLFNRLNLWNSDPTAVDIAYTSASGLAALQQAIGRPQVGSSTEMHGIPLKVKVKVRPARTDPATGKAYDASNEIAKYASINADVGGAGSGGSIASGVPGAAAGVPPWAAAGGAPAAAAPAPAAAAPAPAHAPPVSAAPPAGAQPWQQPGATAAAAAPAPAADGAPPWLAGAAAPAAAAAPAPAAPAPAAAPPPQATPAGPVMLPAAQTTYEEYKKAGWTDEQLIAHGFMAPAAAPAPAAAAPAPAAAPAAPGARPPWAT